MDALHTAMRLRTYLLRKGNPSERFAETIPTADYIAPEVFRSMPTNCGKVPGGWYPHWTSTWAAASSRLWTL